MRFDDIFSHIFEDFFRARNLENYPYRRGFDKLYRGYFISISWQLGGRAVKKIIGLIASLSLSTQAVAADLILYPVQVGQETIRYRTGIPTLTIDQPGGTVTVTPLPLDHGHATFAVAVYNKGDNSSNFGIENISASVRGREIVILSREELQKRAKSRAAWSAFGIAMLTGLAAGAAATAHTTNTSYGNVRTPHGTYAWTSSYRDNTIGVIGATAAISAGTAGIVGIQNRLDYTLGTLATDILQTTTVDPDNSFGGIVVVEKPEGVSNPYDVTLTVNFGGGAFPFTFRLTEQGKNKPAPFTDAALGNRPRTVTPTAAPATAPSPVSSVSTAAPAPVPATKVGA